MFASIGYGILGAATISPSQAAQITVIVVGLSIVAFGLSVSLHSFTLQRTQSHMHPVSNTFLTGVMAGIAGAVAGWMQQEIGATLGTILGVIVGGAVGGIVSAMISLINDAIVSLPPRRISLLGLICIVTGAIVGVMQLVLLQLFPALP